MKMKIDKMKKQQVERKGILLDRYFSVKIFQDYNENKAF